jgi:hypothetical protein
MWLDEAFSGIFRRFSEPSGSEKHLLPANSSSKNLDLVF